jgi:nitrite reductase/ring-hydroxylating ferredoxin subunit
MASHAVHIGADPVVAARLDRLGSDLGLRWTTAADAVEPDLVVIDLGPAESLDAIAQIRSVWPRALIAGYLGIPDGERWVAAQRAGADLVAHRGALASRLRTALACRSDERLFPLLAEADLAGRLGLVARIENGPEGAPLAIYQVGGTVRVVDDRCPHAGASLSGGELDGQVVTCPAHGSQFDVTTGERVRGPADCSLSTYRVVIESGQVAVMVPPPT